MSVEQAIIAIIEGDDDYGDLAAAEDLANAIYESRTRSQHVAVLRAMHSLARKHPEKFALTDGKGRDPLWIGSPRDVERMIAEENR